MPNEPSDTDCRFDQLLAEYFDWVDQSQCTDVDRFVKESGRTESRELGQMLRDYVEASREVECIATETLSDWLDLNASFTHIVVDDGDIRLRSDGTGNAFRGNLYIETLRDVLARSNKIIIDEGAEGGQGVVPYLPLNELSRGRGTSAGGQ